MKLSGIFKECAISVMAAMDPKGKVEDALRRDGWQFKQSMTEEEVRDYILSCSAAGPVPILPNETKIFTPEGQEVFPKGQRDEALELRYKQARRTAAIREYGLN